MSRTPATVNERLERLERAVRRLSTQMRRHVFTRNEVEVIGFMPDDAADELDLDIEEGGIEPVACEVEVTKPRRKR